MTKNIVLIGFMGSGKTTIGKILAKELGYRFVDTDGLIEANESMSIPQIFETKGETYFRQSETEALKQVINQHNCVISTGGGIVTVEANKESLNKGIVIYLEATPDQIYKNVKNDGSRPLLKGDDMYDKICSLLSERENLYKEAAHHTIGVDNKTPNQITTLILRGIQ